MHEHTIVRVPRIASPLPLTLVLNVERAIPDDVQHSFNAAPTFDTTDTDSDDDSDASKGTAVLVLILLLLLLLASERAEARFGW